MKVCLISPPTVSDFIDRRVAEPEARRLIIQYAPVGVLSLAAVLEGLGGEVSFVDLNRLFYDQINPDQGPDRAMDFVSHVVAHLEAAQFDVIGFSTICSTYPMTLRLAREVRRTHPESVIVLGGPQASVVDVSTLSSFPFVDYILRGESEATFPLLLDAVSSGSAGVKFIPGLTYRSGSEVKRNPNAPVIEDLDSLPLPAYHLYPQVADYGFLPLEAGRGCPFACSFCSTNDFFRRRYRMKSPEVLVGQMRLLKQMYGVSFFELIHDMFTADRKRVSDICDEIMKSGERLFWNCSARTDCADDELLSSMARSGCRGIFFGIDSGSDRIQKQIHKGLSISDSLSRVRRASNHQMATTVSLIGGYPDETEEDLRATVNFIGETLRSRRADPQFHLLAPLAETPLTTEYSGELIFDEIYSDQSFHEWSKMSEERAMIIGHPENFTNFYSIPTRWLDRRRLRYLRDFLLLGAASHRWLMLLLHQLTGDLSGVFAAWMAWRIEVRGMGSDDAIPFESRPNDSYSREFLTFVRTKYLNGDKNVYAPLIETIVSVDEAILSLNEIFEGKDVKHRRGRRKQAGAVTLNAIPELAKNVRLVEVESDYSKLVKCLIRRGNLGRLPVALQGIAILRAGELNKIIQPSRRAFDLLSLCDGSRTIHEIVNHELVGESVGNIAADRANLYGLELLLNQGFIRVELA